VHLRRRDDGQIVRIAPIPGVDPEQDLTVRAARLMAQASGSRLGVEIGLDKRSRWRGLGGGSSDAATVLLGLNRLWGLDWDAIASPRWACGLGADVRFFVFGQTPTPPASASACSRFAWRKRWYVILAAPRDGCRPRRRLLAPRLTP